MLNERTAELLLDLPRDQLLALIGCERDSDLAFGPREFLRQCQESAVQKIRAAKPVICGNEHVRKFCDDPGLFRKAEIVCLVADILGCSGAAVLAALVVQEGLSGLCGQASDGERRA